VKRLCQVNNNNKANELGGLEKAPLFYYFDINKSTPRGTAIPRGSNTTRSISMNIYPSACTRCESPMKPKANKIFCSRGCKEKSRRSRNARPYKVHKKMVCERCKFIPEHMCQLDVDHIDGNSQNNDISNLMTLCANCHRLKTKKNKDWNRLEYRS
jgi:hypothetical protein